MKITLMWYGSEFITYIENLSFPFTMIGKIAPCPDSALAEKSTYIAPFVNAEECDYLVIEDDFPNGRPNMLNKLYSAFTAVNT